MSFVGKEAYSNNTIVDKIRNKSSEDGLDENLKKVWLTEGYSKDSVKEHINHLLKELEYQKASFEMQLKELMDEKEKLISEKRLLSDQLEEAVGLINNNKNEYADNEDREAIIAGLKKEVEENKKDMNDYYVLINKLRTQIIEANDEIENLKTQQIKGAEELEKSEKSSDEIQILIEENEALKEELETLNNKISYYESVQKASEDTQETAMNDLLKIKVEENERIIVEKEKLANSFTSLSNYLNEIVFREKEQNAKILETVQTFEKNIEEKDQEIQFYKEEIEKVNEKMELKNTEYNELKSKLDVAVDRLGEQKDKIEYLETANNVLIKQLDEQREKNRKLSGLDANKNITELFFNKDE